MYSREGREDLRFIWQSFLRRKTMKKTFAPILAAGLVMTAAPGMNAFADDLGDPVTLTVTLTAVSTDAHAQAMMAMRDYVEETSGGSMTIDVFTDAQLFSREEEKDIVFFEKGGQPVQIRPGMFYVVFPQDSHMPCRHPEGLSLCRKIVLKIAAE